jgi:hypothetical protein
MCRRIFCESILSPAPSDATSGGKLETARPTESSPPSSKNPAAPIGGRLIEVLGSGGWMVALPSEDAKASDAVMEKVAVDTERGSSDMVSPDQAPSTRLSKIEDICETIIHAGQCMGP